MHHPVTEPRKPASDYCMELGTGVVPVFGTRTFEPGRRNVAYAVEHRADAGILKRLRPRPTDTSGRAAARIDPQRPPRQAKRLGSYDSHGLRTEFAGDPLRHYASARVN